MSHRLASLGDDAIERFQGNILRFFHEQGRRFPWRTTNDPYAIYVSEIMLQQTQTYRVEGRYGLFLSRFPTVASLAEAALPQVLQLWQGLGYNRRAKGLRDGARMIEEQYGGIIPQKVSELERLPMVGPYTARAIATFAYGSVEVLIETNIRAVYLHEFFPHEKSVPDDHLIPLIGATIYRPDPRRWYYALMDYGAFLKSQGGKINHRSSHYRKQSPFAGSRRQVRSAILKALLTTGAMGIDALTSYLGIVDSLIGNTLGELVRDGLVTEQHGSFSIAP